MFLNGSQGEVVSPGVRGQEGVTDMGLQSALRK